MTESKHEEYWADNLDAGESKGPGFYFELHLINLSAEQTRKVREQAEKVVGRYAQSERAIILQTFRSIVRIATVRLESVPFGGPANVYLVRVAPDPTDPLDQVGDDRGHIIARALAFADDPDPMVVEVWRRVAEGFDMLRYREQALREA